MVTDAAWSDINGDSWQDLIVVGEFMAIEIFENHQGKSFERITGRAFERPLTGMWDTMMAVDFDGDGDEDIVAGNLGLNTQLRASVSEPITLVFKDFDKNGSVDPMLNQYIQGVSYPFASRDELLDQFYYLRSKYTSYASYASAQMNNIFSAGDLKDAPVLKVTTLESIYLENKDGRFVVHPLPVEAQFAPLYALAAKDVNKDGKLDIIAAGNQSSIRIRMGVIDANFGHVYLGDGKGNFSFVPQEKTGMKVTGDTKSMKIVAIDGHDYLLIGINNVGIETYKLN